MTDEEFSAFNDVWWRFLLEMERRSFWYRLPYVVMGIAAFVGVPIGLLIVWIS